ncbi:MAG: response regulator [Chthoniobacterales bacterium]
MKWIPFEPNWSASSVLTPPPSPEASPNAKPNAGLTALRKIVIAEDDPVSREILTTLLGKWGFHVVAAKDGQEAMAILRAETQPVLAILDWMMPGMEGTEICRRVREVSRSVYILLLTARTGKDSVVEGLRAGADDYLTKPFDKDELRARLSVGARIIDLQTTLTARVQELEAAQTENRELRMQMPL